MFSLARALLSPGSAEDRSSLFAWFIDTMARSDSSQSVRVRRVALGLRGPASFPCGPRRSRGLPVLVHVVSRRARVLRLRRTDCSLAISRTAVLPSSYQERVGVLVLRFSKLNSPAHRYPCLRFE